VQGRILRHSRDRKAGANGEYKADLNTGRDLSTRPAGTIMRLPWEAELSDVVYCKR
jgi:hypothetical protein